MRSFYRNQQIDISYLLVLLLSFVISCSFFKFSDTKNEIDSLDSKPLYKAQITAVVDGDTVKVQFENEIPENCSTNETIRLIGINTPELNLNKNKEPEYYAEEAYQFTNKYWNKKVYVQLDDVTGLRDKYSRLLAYIQLSDGKLLNELLLEEGYARYYDNFKFNKQRMDDFSKAEIKAKLSKKGLWK